MKNYYEILDLKTFGELIRYYRLKNGLSQHDLALALGTTQRIISMVENGLYNPTLEMVFRFLSYFDLSLYVL